MIEDALTTCIIVFFGMFLFGLIGFVCCNSDKEEKGALYFNKAEKSVFVCNGILKTHYGCSTQYKFICNDGKVITNLTNFTLKAVE